jgi:WD40 repeat protein
VVAAPVVAAPVVTAPAAATPAAEAQTKAVAPAPASTVLAPPLPVTTAPTAEQSAKPASPRPVAKPATAASAPPASPSVAETKRPSAPETAAKAPPEQHLALIIGNSRYQKFAPLPNPVNDAHAVALKLRQLGFTVIEQENASREDMVRLGREFGNRLKLGGVGLFYYAGHGIQSSGVNYLVPVDADIQDEDELPSRTYDANELLGKMDAAKNRMNVIILDACRDNPFARSFRSVTRGLAQVQQGTGTIIAYSTQPGNTAADGSSGYGLYTQELLNALSQPGLSIEEVFKRVRVEVTKKSGGRQVPWENSSLVGDFYFNPTPEQAAALPALAVNYTSAPLVSQARGLAAAVVSRKLLETYQLAANLPMAAPFTLGEFTPDGRYFIMVTQDGLLKSWDAATGNLAFSHSGFIQPVLSSDGRYLIGLTDEISSERSINLLDTTLKSYAITIYRGFGDVQRVSISPNGQRMMVFTRDGNLTLQSVQSGNIVGTPYKIQGELRFEFSPMGNRVLVWGTKKSDVFLIDLDSGLRVGNTSSHRKPVGFARFSPDGSLLLTASEGDAAVVWRTADGASLKKFSFGDKSPLPKRAEFIDGGAHLLINVAQSDKVTGETHKLGVWDVASGTPISTVIQDVVAKDMRFSADGQMLFISAIDNSIRVVDMATKTERTALSGAELVDLSPDGQRLIAREGDGIRVYDAHTLLPVARMPAQTNAFVAPKKSGLLVTTAPDGGLRLWDLQHGDPVALLKDHSDPVSLVNFAVDGKQFVSVSKEHVAKLWAIPDLQDLTRLTKQADESADDYFRRVADWSASYTHLVTLGGYNAESETYSVKMGEFSIDVPMPHDEAMRLAGQHEAILTGRLKVYDADQLQLSDGKLSRIP